MSHPSDYLVTIQRLPKDLGTGYVAIVPDLPGCMSDGETPREALDNVQDAIAAWMNRAQEMGRVVPEPTSPEPEVLQKYG